MEGSNQKVRLGKSILVPCVQELAKQCIGTIPNRYAQPYQDDINEHDHDNISNYDPQLPVIDMELLISGDELELHKFHSACKEWGFFQIINHGVNLTLVEKFKLETQEFFNLPFEEKKKYWQTTTEVEGFGQAFVVSEEQKLDWADIFFATTLPKHQHLPHLIPMLPLPYRYTLENYSVELEKLALKIFDCMAKTLEIDSKVIRSAFGEGKQTMRMNYYPPCPEPEKVIGLTPHSDAVALTILLQLNEIEGLQVMKDGKWVLVKPFPYAFVVNIGDILEILSNGIYRSILHRAIVNATKERLSVATFYTPGIGMEIGPIPDLITPKTPAKFKRISMSDYFEGLFSRSLDGKSYLDVMRIN